MWVCLPLLCCPSPVQSPHQQALRWHLALGGLPVCRGQVVVKAPAHSRLPIAGYLDSRYLAGVG